MNDPHVEALYYKLTHSEYVDYKKAPPMELDKEHFKMILKDDQATFTMKTHYASEAEARSYVDPFV